MMLEQIDMAAFKSLEGELRKAAHALTVVWHDRQYDYFEQTYVGEAESFVRNKVDELDEVNDMLYVCQSELEGLV